MDMFSSIVDIKQHFHNLSDKEIKFLCIDPHQLRSGEDKRISSPGLVRGCACIRPDAIVSTDDNVSYETDMSRT
jgi:hypothetical protein